MKSMLLIISLSISLMLVGNQIAYSGGEGPQPGESILGPTMDGVVWITPISGSIDGVFLGNCNGKPIVVAYSLPNGFDTVTIDSLVNYRVGPYGPPGCRSEFGGEYLIITAVKNFDKNDERILADVDIKFVIPK